MRSREHLEQFQQTLQGRIDETTDPQMRSFCQETLENVQSQLDQLATEEQQGYEDPKMREYRLLHQGEPPRETKRSHVVFADEEPREAERYRVVREGENYRFVRDQQEETGVSMPEIVTCVRCGQWVHDPENGRVCAECKAADLEDEHREEIESALAYLDALTAIEISADANASGCYSPELLDRGGAMGEDNHRQRLLIKALILVGHGWRWRTSGRLIRIRWS